MKLLIWPEETNCEIWYYCAICDKDGKPIGGIYKADDYELIANHANYYASRLGLSVEDRCQLKQKK